MRVRTRSASLTGIGSPPRSTDHSRSRVTSASGSAAAAWASPLAAGAFVNQPSGPRRLGAGASSGQALGRAGATALVLGGAAVVAASSSGQVGGVVGRGDSCFGVAGSGGDFRAAGG